MGCKKDSADGQCGGEGSPPARAASWKSRVEMCRTGERVALYVGGG